MYQLPKKGEKISYEKLKEIFCEFERENKTNEALTAHIVFTENSFKDYYPLESRTYITYSSEKAFKPNMCGYSIYGLCLDKSDFCRLEWYIDVERGGKDGWHVDYCYLV